MKNEVISKKRAHLSNRKYPATLRHHCLDIIKKKMIMIMALL